MLMKTATITTGTTIDASNCLLRKKRGNDGFSPANFAAVEEALARRRQFSSVNVSAAAAILPEEVIKDSEEIKVCTLQQQHGFWTLHMNPIGQRILDSDEVLDTNEDADEDETNLEVTQH